MKILESNTRPRDILTREAFENAIAVVAAMGGSTNAVLHMLAIAYEAGVKLDLDDIERIGLEGARARRPEAGGQVRDGGRRRRSEGCPSS